MLNPDLQAKLSRLAAERGSDAQALVQEAVERFVDCDEWFLQEVDKGLAAPTVATSSTMTTSAS